MSTEQAQIVAHALNHFQIELPSWGFANTGTRFGKFVQPAAALNIEEKLADAGMINRLTGCCPSVAVHVAWDFAAGLDSVDEVMRCAGDHGLKIGSINPTLFEDQCFKHGSLGNPDQRIRKLALVHILLSLDIARRTGSRDIVLWFADGSNFPGSANIRRRKQWFEENLSIVGAEAGDDLRLLVEYKPFEPAFYHTDIADWGMSLLMARKASPHARVLVDTGHHYHSQNIEQIVAWLLSEGMLGGFHFNDRRYADDDLTLGSIDPYQIFRILNEISHYAWETGQDPDISYMIDQSHNLKPKMEAIVQTVDIAQQLVAKAALVDRGSLARFQSKAQLVDAEECLRDAYLVDVRPLIRAWRRARKLPEDPLQTLRESGYQRRAAAERAEHNRPPGSSYV